MTPGMIEHIYQFCLEAGVFFVCTSANGETTMYSGWHQDLSSFLDDPRFTLQINSNFARDFTDADLLALNKHSKVQISIDSSSPAMMKEQRTADLRTIISNVVRLKQMMLKTGKKTVLEINCTVTRKNITHIADLARLALVFQVDALGLTEMMEHADLPNVPDGVWDLTDDEAAQFVLSISEAITLLEKTATRFTVRPGLVSKLLPISQAMNAGLKPSAESLRTGDNEDLNLGPCMQPWQTVIVLADGNVRTCCGMDYSVGNINEQSLSEIVNGDAARDVRAKLLSGESELPCSRCWAAQANTPESFRAQVQRAQEQFDALHGVPALVTGSPVAVG